MSDIRVENHGTIVLVVPLTDAGRAWADEHIQAEGWAYMGPAIACEPRYAAAIIEGALEDALDVEVGP